MDPGGATWLGLLAWQSMLHSKNSIDQERPTPLKLAGAEMDPGPEPSLAPRMLCYEPHESLWSVCFVDFQVVACLKWGKRCLALTSKQLRAPRSNVWGSSRGCGCIAGYSSVYVNRLWAASRRHLRMPSRFVCFTEDLTHVTHMTAYAHAL